MTDTWLIKALIEIYETGNTQTQEARHIIFVPKDSMTLTQGIAQLKGISGPKNRSGESQSHLRYSPP